MSSWLICVTIVCYAGTGVEKAVAGEWAWGVFWTAYAIANVAYLLAQK